MQLKVIGSSSAGNCYLIFNREECLIIELGFKFNVIKQTLNYNLSNVVGALVTHMHGDHSKGMLEAINAGIDVYASAGTIKEMGYLSPRLHAISHGKEYKIGNFEVKPFDVTHDVPEPLGFLIRHPEIGSMVFMTDLQYSPYIFDPITHYLVEANYCQNILNQKRQAGLLHPSVERHVRQGHMSIQTCSNLLSENDLSQTINIVLLHLSDSNSDARAFQKQIQAETAKTVYIADKGLLIDLNLHPF